MTPEELEEQEQRKIKPLVQPKAFTPPPAPVKAEPLPYLPETPPAAPQPDAIKPFEALPIEAAPPVPSAPKIKPLVDPNVQAHQQELNRVTTGETGKSGIAQIHNPVLRTLGTIGDVIASGIFPQIGMFLPGTSAHHQMVVNSASNAVSRDQEAQKAADASAMEQAKTATELGKPELQAETSQNAADKIENERVRRENELKIKQDHEAHESKDKASQDARDLAKLGMKRDDNGAIVPQLPHELSPELLDKHIATQSLADLKKSQSDLAVASAELKRAQAAGEPEKIAIAKKKADQAMVSQSMAMERLGLAKANFELGAFGTVNGVQPNGGLQDANGAPVGTKNAANIRPAPATRTKADQGSAIKIAGDNLIKEIDAKAKKVGNIESYWNQFVNGSPISDPDVSGLMTSLSSFAALQPALHGFRGQRALSEFAKIIGGIPKNPEALKAAIKSIQGTAGVLQQVGTPRTAGSSAPAKEITTKQEYDALPSGSVFLEDGKKYRKP
jgi:hypothetical protein